MERMILSHLTAWITTFILSDPVTRYRFVGHCFLITFTMDVTNAKKSEPETASADCAPEGNSLSSQIIADTSVSCPERSLRLLGDHKPNRASPDSVVWRAAGARRGGLGKWGFPLD